MNRRGAAGLVAALLALAACAKRDPFDEPDYAAACHGPPLGNVEARNQAFEDGYVTPDPQDGKRHPAIIWITGGDSSTLEDFWSEGPPENDQTASAFRKAGVVMMFPTLRGGNTDGGQKEFSFGEVEHIHAAAGHLAKLPYVDPARLYLGGHSTGGTLALPAAETGGRFIAVFAFGPDSSVDRYPNSLFPMDLPGVDRREIELRSPAKWTAAISSDTYVIEGMAPGSNYAELQTICDGNANPRLVCTGGPGATHFSVLRLLPILAENFANGDGRTFGLRSGDFKPPPADQRGAWASKRWPVTPRLAGPNNAT